MKQPRCSATLTHGEIGFPVVIKVGSGHSALLTVRSDATPRKLARLRSSPSHRRAAKGRGRCHNERLRLGTSKAFCARNRSTTPSPSKSSAHRSNAGANWEASGSGRISKRPVLLRKTAPDRSVISSDFMLPNAVPIICRSDAAGEYLVAGDRALDVRKRFGEHF